jgi:hypothetical protein
LESDYRMLRYAIDSCTALAEPRLVTLTKPELWCVARGSNHGGQTFTRAVLDGSMPQRSADLNDQQRLFTHHPEIAGWPPVEWADPDARLPTASWPPTTLRDREIRHVRASKVTGP